jgi:hypothetical protein
VQHDRVAHALDAGRGDHALPLDRHRLGSPGPQRVGHRLDVLLVHQQVADVLAGRLQGGVRRVVERDHHAGSLHRAPPGRAPEPVDLALGHVDGRAVQVLGQPVHLAGQVGGPGAEPGQVVRLGGGETGQVVVPPRAKVGTLRADHAGHEQRAGQHEHHRCEQLPPLQPGRTRRPGQSGAPAWATSPVRMDGHGQLR